MGGKGEGGRVGGRGREREGGGGREGGGKRGLVELGGRGRGDIRQVV